MCARVGVEVKLVDAPDDSRTFIDGSRRSAVRLSDVVIGRGFYRPGWRWSQHARPLTGKDSERHMGYVISGRMAVRSREGTEVEVASSGVFVAEPGHDAWVMGDEPCIALDFATGTASD